MEYMISAIWVGATVLFDFLWSAAFFRCRRSPAVRRNLFLICWLLCFLEANLSTVQELNVLFVAVIFILSSFYLYKAPWYMHLIIAVFAVLIVILCETGVFYFFSGLLHMSFTEVIPHKVLYIAYCVSYETIVHSLPEFKKLAAEYFSK